MWYKKKIWLLLVAALMVSSLTSCSLKGKKQPVSTTGFAFDTTYTINLYEGGSQELINSCIKKCSYYESVFSRTAESSQVYGINEIASCYQKAVRTKKTTQAMWKKRKVTYTQEQIQAMYSIINQHKSEKNKCQYSIKKDGRLTFIVSDELRAIIEKGLYYSAQSKGAFDITILPVSSLWDFQGSDARVPDKDEIESAKERVSYQKVDIKGNTLTFLMPGMGLDLGGIAKGYIADKLKSYLLEKGVRSGVINLGGNVLCIGKKSEDSKFQIGVQQPFADRNETVFALAIDDLSVVSSGIYERYFKKDGKIYHHILNPRTGYSYDNDLMAVTILSKESVDGDALSTTCFSLGVDKGLAYINQLKDTEAVFITKDEKKYYSKNFKKYII